MLRRGILDACDGTIAAALAAVRFARLSLAFLAACAAPMAPDELEDPNAGMLRDFQDGKYDAAGHPLNATVVAAADLCGGTALGTPCKAALPGGAQRGAMQVNARLRVTSHPERGEVITIRVRDAATDLVLGEQQLTVARLRGRASWIDLPVGWSSAGDAVTIELAPAPGSAIELDYVEVFPRHIGLVVSPGSGVLADDEWLTLELPKNATLTKLTADGVDLTAHVEQLIDDGIAEKQVTSFRTVIELPVGALLGDARAEVVDLRVVAGSDAARAELRTTSQACTFSSGTTGTKVLVTGFQPFPADGWHDNVSAVGVTAADPARIAGARVMKMILPVEYDRAAAMIQDAIARCAPDVVISFGQGGGAIALESTAYNLQDTGEVSGGVPDNRGIVRAAQPIDPAAPAERATLLPLAAIDAALTAIGEAPRDSDDPGRYICNNVMFSTLGAMAPRGGRSGFIHLPYTTTFDEATRARYARVVEAAIAATVAN